MKLSLVFWNIRHAVGTQLLLSLTRLADQGTDVFIFAESPSDGTPLLNALNSSGRRMFQEIPSQNRRVLFFSAVNRAEWTDRFYDPLNDRLTAQELQIPGIPSLLLVGAHLRAANRGRAWDRLEWSRQHAQLIRLLERDAGHQRTILVGDLNMNPFSQAMTFAEGFHAMMSRALARSVTTQTVRKRRPTFYNPMWSCLGDRGTNGTIRPAGTYFFANTEERTNRFWQMYDQVLLRPAVMDMLTRLEILDTDGVVSFVTKEGRPRTSTISDHLPIRFELTLSGAE